LLSSGGPVLFGNPSPMENRSGINSTIRFFLIEFVMVFLGVLLAFWVNDFGDRIRNKKYAEQIVKNIVADIKSDSVNIREAILMIDFQYETLMSLTRHLRNGHYDSANLFVKACYISYNAFEPNTQSYQSMIYGGDLKLIDDYEVIKLIKEIDQANHQLNQVHSLYYKAVEDIRNTFISKENMDDLNFKRLRSQSEFWNKVNFLQETYLKNYAKVLKHSQSKYHELLALTSTSRVS
jgi:hypothetical protein